MDEVNTEWIRWGLRELGRLMRSGDISAIELTSLCIERIENVDHQVNAVLGLAPDALSQAAAADRRHRSGAARGPLDGIPVLLKDNIHTAGLLSTVGSRLLPQPPERDAEVVRRLREAGAVVLGKTNLSEWANFRSVRGTEGWSGVGGQTSSPYLLGRSPWGSSSGSAVAVAAGMAPLALGTETDGSVLGPAGVNGVVGVKPQVGLLPTAGIAPVSGALDSVGVLSRSVSDALLTIAVLTGRPVFNDEPARTGGRRFGSWLPPGTPDRVREAAKVAWNRLRHAGAVVLPVELAVPGDLVLDGLRAMYAEFGEAIDDYLRGRSEAPDSLVGLISANRADPVETRLFGQDLFEWVATMSEDERAEGLAARGPVRARAQALCADVLRRHRVEAVLVPTNEPAWPIDTVNGDRDRFSTSSLSALAGYPAVSLPIGLIDGLPVGMTVFGPPELDRFLDVAVALDHVCGDRPVPTFHAAAERGSMV
ncbi:amidase family protein [Micromonospora sp. 15K316]|uniref:amidase family protein n=1 Tax=Micromonospora sp. 15K316 TaxID=2530376 RepID=UPI001A9E01CB|nr:amidase family protein [Micromonospora sp. 15K316]